ncbi:MAG: RagB/SusD family nutrient uptake outer membrane protein [Labilibaculum sp.]|nr:RagB/SusD family nutrient uptake outer membrane protein [Labilibaculum sp.]MBI9059047.1 RagB/SusD family nutrient uptake outer membrane protein [Labilibaculum sp.]
MNKKYLQSIYIIVLFLFSSAVISCTDDLDTIPLDDDIQIEVSTDEDFKQLMAKCYANLILGGQTGSDRDISRLDVNFSSYLRLLFNMQELTTDEAICAWNDGNLRDLHDMDWNSQNEFITAIYSRINLGVSYSNKLIQQIGEQSKYSDYLLEARVLRALAYWHMLDMFGTAPFVTEADPIGSFFFPEQASSEDLFEYLETELKAIENELPEPGANQYGRADRGLAWMLLAKLYLNAEVYIGQEKYSECISYCNKFTGNGFYSLEPVYKNLFLADNHLRRNEIIFSICSDGKRTQGAGGMSFLIHAGIGGTMKGSDYGVSGGWGGNRTTKALVNKFSDPTGMTDIRAQFHSDGQTLEIDDIFAFSHGYAVAKYINITSMGESGSDLEYVDTDFPLFRYADVLLMYAECVVRGGSGADAVTALTYVNQIRERAYGDTSGNITSSEMTLDWLLDERARELHWEGHRRTDLVRFDRLTGGDYLWPWKGNAKEGASTNARFNVFPIPSSDINSNPNLVQNEGY